MLWDGRARKINLVDLKKKKKVVKILGNFFKNPPPLEKILDPPLLIAEVSTLMGLKVGICPSSERRNLITGSIITKNQIVPICKENHVLRLAT